MSHVTTPARHEELERRLAELIGHSHILAFQRVSSTMDIAHDAAASGAPDRTLVWAAAQEQGRGRLGRRWESPQGGAYFSLLLRPSRPSVEWPQLSLVVGLATAEAVRHLIGDSPSIRWPNDLLLHDLKIAGVLAEARAGAVVIGIGINVRAVEGLPATAGVLNLADPLQLTAAAYRRFVPWYEAWSEKGFAPIRQALRNWMSFGQPVQLSAGAQQLQGTAADVDEQGRLVVRLDSGLMRAFDMGEVTLLR